MNAQNNNKQDDHHNKERPFFRIYLFLVNT